MDTSSSNGNTGKYNFMVQPFPIRFDSNDLHVIVFIEGHPEYEAIEAMIRERDGNIPYIRVILTRTDKTQIDHINDKNAAVKSNGRKSRREVCYTDISCNMSGAEGKKKITISFTSFKGESIIVETSPASKPSSKYGGLINPLGHSRNTSLPVMYSEKSTLISSKSLVCIDGKECKIPVKVWVPFFFKGMAGYYSELFNIGVIRSGLEHAILLESPEELKVGKQWVYKYGNDILTYKITEADKNFITVRGRNDGIFLEQNEEGILLRKVMLYSACKRYEAVFSLSFNPGVLVWAASKQVHLKEKGEFIISINGHNSLITGNVSSECRDSSTKILLEPAQPDWAVERKVSLAVSSLRSELSANTEIL